MIIAFLPVRIGSKSISNKNIKDFCGKPLLYWAVKAVSESNKIDRVVVASDSELIDESIGKYELDKVEIYRRNPKNAQDDSSTESVMLEYLEQESLNEDDVFILVQATNPFLQTSDVEEGLKLVESGFNSVLSCTRDKRFFWNEDGTPLNYDYTKRPRRQDFDGILKENGAFYVSKVGDIIQSQNRLNGKIGIVQMPQYSEIELDEEDDWPIAESLFKKHIVGRQELKLPKLVATDVDGVLTDAGMYYSEKGDELKKFNTRDGKGFELLRKNGIKTAIVTSESTELVQRRADKLKADYLSQGKEHGGKLQAILEICQKENIELKDVAYIGDDVNCKELLEKVGLAACPVDSVMEIKSLENIFVIPVQGGNGVFRYLVDTILNGQSI